VLIGLFVIDPPHCFPVHANAQAGIEQPSVSATEVVANSTTVGECDYGFHRAASVPEWAEFQLTAADFVLPSS